MRTVSLTVFGKELFRDCPGVAVNKAAGATARQTTLVSLQRVVSRACAESVNRVFTPHARSSSTAHRAVGGDEGDQHTVAQVDPYFIQFVAQALMVPFTMIIMGDKLGDGASKVAPPNGIKRSRHSSLIERTKSSAYAFAF